MLAKNYQHFIIGGTIKAATSSLFNYISAHPQVCGSKVKETFFFSRTYSGDAEADYRKYASYFSPDADNQILMEASPNYLTFKEEVAPRIKQLFPEIKLLFVLRNPVDRLYSHFNFAKGKIQLAEKISFEEFVDLCERFNNGEITPADVDIVENHLGALEIGNYGRYLKNFYDVFDAANIKVVFFEDLKDQPLETLKAISKFIGVSPSFYDDFTFTKANVTYSARLKLLHLYALLFNRLLEPVFRKLPALKHRLVRIYKFFNQNKKNVAPMRDETREKLMDYYAPSNAELRRMLKDQSLPYWID